MTRSAVLCLVLLASIDARGKMRAPPEPTPVHRAIANIEREFKKDPKNPRVHFVLGRLHLMAYGGTQQVRLVDQEGEPYLYTDDPAPAAPPGKGPAAELDRAIDELRTSARLEPKAPATSLSLAWALEERATTTHSADDRAAALAAYRSTFAETKLSAAEPMRGMGPDLDVEAAQAILRLLPPGSDGGATTEADQLRTYLARTEHAGRAISPVVVLLDGSSSLAARVDPKAHVHFDLDGMGKKRSWPWLQAGAALLVWDPDRCGRIRDGWQLFGNVTWWGVWQDGYEPLAALDDDGDGKLTGSELEGIGLWIDRNGDGVSDPGEVVDAREYGVVRLSVARDGIREGVAWQRAGVMLRDGRTLSTFDWVPRSDGEPRISAR